MRNSFWMNFKIVRESDMAEELKIRIRDYKSVEQHLKNLGGKFLEELNVINIYFNQQKGFVLKIAEYDKGAFLVNLKSKDGKFDILKYESIDNLDQVKRELTGKYGVKCILKKKRRLWSLEGTPIDINLIENVGEFLIVEGENLKEDIITNKLKIKNPEFVRVSFDDLKK